MNCRVCGRQFDPSRFQIMVPGIKHGFDRVDCALEASALGVPPERSDEALPATFKALPAPVPTLAGVPMAMVGGQTVRPQLLAGANLALLAAGAAATIYLWLRVFGPDVGPLALPAASPSPAFERTTVAASIDLSPAAEVRPLPESAVRGGGSQLALAVPAFFVSGEGDGTLASDRKPRKEQNDRGRGNRGPVARPAPQPAPAPPPAPSPARSAPVPNYPVPSTPPPNRAPGPSIPSGGGSSPEQPSPPGPPRP